MDIEYLSLTVFNHNLRMLITLVLYHDRLTSSALTFLFDTYRLAFHDINKLDNTSNLCQYRSSVRIPGEQLLIRFDSLSVLCKNDTAIRDLIFIQLAIFLIEQCYLAISLKRNQKLRTVFCLKRNNSHVAILYLTCNCRILLTLKDSTFRNTSSMECSKSQLCTGLSNRLSRDYTYRRAFFDQRTCAQIPAITLGTKTKWTVTGQRTSNSDSIHTKRFKLIGYLTGNNLILINYHLIGHRISNIISGCPTNNKIFKLNIFLFIITRRIFRNTLQCTAVMLGNNNILCNIDKLTGKITRVGRLQRRISKTFSSTVSRAEILKNCHTFTEIRFNRSFNNLSAGLGHQCSHTC